jgi:hypothetical protein
VVWDARPDLGIESQWIPIQAIANGDATGLEAVNFLEAEALAVEMAEDPSTTFGT